MEKADMLQGMTAFARRETRTTRGVLSWELRTLNHRYLDVSLRLPDEFRPLEMQVRERIAARVRRGKLDGALRFESDASAPAELTLNEALVDRLLDMLGRVEGRMGNPARPASIELLKWPNVLQAVEPDPELLHAEALKLLERTLDDLGKSRTREGSTIRDLILQRCADIGRQAALVQERMPDILAHHRAKLVARLDELETGFDAGRLEQELLYITQKADVQEELDRLKAHLDEVTRVLDAGGPVGRRLDFLMQELNREANTLGSKSIDASTTRASVDIKVAIEQIREQVQNVE
jgi:uncharacterized protein (TIGR00255 family)